ncbi:MAG: helix-turn-helix domain-containing protein [Lewinellaceae bacterium]|nr:helix-turn-helix domain-containing protein [Lewinellaceae bacterium]
MNKYEKIYKELRKQFSDEEIVERYVFPDDLSEQERKEIEDEFRKLRLKTLKERTEKQRLLSELMRMKLLVKDYLERSHFEEEFSFPNQLEQYIRILGRSKKDFAGEIGLHPTKLSRLLTGRENPNVELAYRLEKHCGNIIPAIYWWKLHAKKLEEEIKTDEETRRVEREKVKNDLQFRA